MTRTRTLLAALAVLMLLLVVSGLNPRERLTWFMEILPILIALPFAWRTYRSFPLTPLVYVLLFLHAVVLMVGGAWTYAHVPLGFWVQDLFSLERNPYDKLGHFMQGFVPALVLREIFVRLELVRGRKVLVLVVLSMVLAVSAFYEFIEWWAALIMGEGAQEFLGTQGDEWDTQSDMLVCLIGGALALLLLSRLQDRQIAALAEPKTRGQARA